MSARPQRVFSLGPMPPERCAYALARYSRSPDSIRQSLDWVRQHDAQQFLEHYYFQYGHASIADLGHLVLCFEGISELAAVEIEDEPLWDGQARSSRYQDFAQAGFIVPPELVTDVDRARYAQSAQALLEGYRRVHQAVQELLRERYPKSADMDAAVYQRTIRARAFDVARYLLFLGVPTNVGQITSIRTLEKQIRRLKASPYQELRELAEEIAAACNRPPDLQWAAAAPAEPLAPTLARHTSTDSYLEATTKDLAEWAQQNLPPLPRPQPELVDVLRPEDPVADVVATLLYPVTHYSYRQLYSLARQWSSRQRNEVLDLATRHRRSRDELLRAFRGAPYVIDLTVDIGAYRDLHRHRRCHQFRQPYSTAWGYEIPMWIREVGLATVYHEALDQAYATIEQLPALGRDYLLPFATRIRALFKMDFAELDYICRLRTSPKGHFSYRRIAWEMKQKFERLEPELGRLIQATPPEVEDLLTR